MTSEDAINWVRSQKPGDKVIHCSMNCNQQTAENILTVKKVTPTGIVRTEEGFDFQQSKWFTDSSSVVGYGKTFGEIVPYTEALKQEVLYNRAEKEKAKRAREMINKAKSICWEYAYSRREMTVEAAEAILKFARTKGGTE